MRTTHTYKPKYSHSTSRTIAQKKKDSRVIGYREILEAEEREWNAEEAVGEWGSMSANVMRTLESGQYVPDTAWYEKGLQAKLRIGLPVDKNQEGAKVGGHQVMQPKRIMVQRRAQPLTGDTVITGESLRASRSDNQNKTGLPDRLKAGVENLSGYSMDDVRVHYNSQKPAQLQALAYTQGTDIHVGPGQEKHLAHEAWHVVQQKQGRVKPTKQTDGVEINDDAGLEKESDVMGAKAANKNQGKKHHPKGAVWPICLRADQPVPESGLTRANRPEPFPGKSLHPRIYSKPHLDAQRNGREVQAVSFNWVRKVFKLPAKHVRECGINNRISYHIFTDDYDQVETIKTATNDAFQTVEDGWNGLLRYLAYNRYFTKVVITTKEDEKTNGKSREGETFITVNYKSNEAEELRTTHEGTTKEGQGLANYKLFKTTIIHELGHLVDHALTISRNPTIEERPMYFIHYRTLDEIKEKFQDADNLMIADIPTVEDHVKDKDKRQKLKPNQNNSDNTNERYIYKSLYYSDFKYSTVPVNLYDKREKENQIVSIYEWANVGDQVAENFAYMIFQLSEGANEKNRNFSSTANKIYEKLKEKIGAPQIA
ncbi:DUF4157 domain-containing protein [Moorena sp. SIO4E2]|uniref:eCIS core domain-containing protein n=1 Tax=Moorena sp. SIO4E2 TaxID=2607826 RepID=UPI00257A1F18|nr:DUF4157 domain-containing protein [Moorena sp. SIO4E2]